MVFEATTRNKMKHIMLKQREKEDVMTSFLDSHQSAAAVNKKLRFETSHDLILVIFTSRERHGHTMGDFEE